MKTAVLFPGQGSQGPGMGSDLNARRAEAGGLLGKVNDILGRDLLAVMFNGPEDALKDTFNAQPALYAVGLAAYACLRAEGLRADGFAGHSLGEYCALAATGVFSFGDGLRLVQARAKAMSRAAQAAPGTMAAVLKLDDEVVEAACARATAADPSRAVVPANYNAPGQVVISGAAEGVERASALCREAGGRVLPLAVSGAFHSPAMLPAGRVLREAFA